MSLAKLITGSFLLFTLVVLSSLVVNVPAQDKRNCQATPTNIYFVDSGSGVTEVHPGSNGGNGYQLNIIGDGDNIFEVVKERYMSSLSFLRVYTNPPQAKWEVTFAPNMGRTIAAVRMKNKCTG